MFSTLARLFVTERHRQRAADVGFSVPLYSEVSVTEDIGPLLVTNMRGEFLRSRVSATGSFARFGFVECPVDEESRLVRGLYLALVTHSVREGWTNRASSVDEGLALMRGFGLEPKFVTVPAGVETAYEGLVTLTADLPEGAALISTVAQQAGQYTRTGEHVGVLAQRVDKTFVVIS